MQQPMLTKWSEVYLVRDVGAQIYTQREIEIMWTNRIAEFFRAFEFLLFEPFLKKILSTLCQHGTSKLKRFMTVQSPLVEKDTKILENR
jgi:hypothetical protein